MKKVSKLLAVLLVFALVLMLGACSKPKAEEPEEKEEAVEENTEEEAEETTESEEAMEAETEEDSGDDAEELVGIANPWTEVDSIEAATEGAGLGFFEFDENVSLSLGDHGTPVYRYMEGMVEVDFPIAAVEMTIRKGSFAEDGDVSGDYNVYNHMWAQDVDGITVTCFGNREGEATKTIWTDGESNFALLARGAGGDEDFGLQPEDVAAMVNAIK